MILKGDFMILNDGLCSDKNEKKTKKIQFLVFEIWSIWNVKNVAKFFFRPVSMKIFLGMIEMILRKKNYF